MKVWLLTLGGLKLTGTNFVRVKPLLLLAYLTLEGPRDRRHLAELFWPDAENPLNSLSAALKQLRQGAQGGVEADSVQARSKVEGDAWAFLQASEAGRYEAALALYQGPFLKGIYLPNWGAELEEWVYGTREFLAGRARDALLRLGEQEAGEGRFERAAKRAEAAYFLGASEPEPEELRRFYALLLAGSSPHAANVRKEARGFDIELSLSPTEARERLRRSERASAAPPTLPRRGTSFIGRDVERVEVANLLVRPECSLLTLTGPGGVGKSRLALQVAHDLVGRYAGGVRFVPLEALTHPGLIPSSLAEALGVSLGGGEEPFAQIGRYIGDNAVLLVLDNYEHLMDGTTPLSELLRRCPNLHLLVTSRERLNLEEEWVLPLGGLAVPLEKRSSVEAQYHDAIKLFIERAKRARLSFELTPEALPHIVSICQQVQGLPLGLELAAAWVKLLPCQEIAQELTRNTDFLTSPNRNAPERHKSVRAVFEGSWRLLTPTEREVLRKLSVFRGGFRREAAAEVVGATIPVLASLIDKSLLSVTSSGRYDFHPLLHQYTQEALAEYPREQARVREKHGRCYFRFLEARSAEFTGTQQQEGLSAITEELENIRLAWAWAVEGKKVDELQCNASLLSLFYEISGRFQEGVAGFGAAVKALEGLGPEHREALSHMLLEYACHNYRLSLFAQATQAAKRGLALARASCNDDLTARNLNSLGQIAWQVGEFSISVQYLEEALVLAEAHNKVVLAAVLVRSIGWVESVKGNYPGAKKRLQEALTLFQQLEMPHEVVDNLNALGHLHVNSGYPSEAQPFFEEGLRLARETGAQVMVPHLLSGAGLALYELERYSEAQAVLKKALQETANELAQAWVLVVLGRTAAATSDYVLAQDYIKQALRISWAARQLPEVLDALVAFSELRIKQGPIADAAATLHIASSHPATTGYSRTLARKLIKGLPNPTVPTVISGEFTLGKPKLLEEVVEEFLS